ncbi:MAG: hypothetical protein QOG23_3135 [Blastocatellia bacterium]|jgi:hypothetical protein|nr:hypothetical protein [Blastocatellia bacterium]
MERKEKHHQSKGEEEIIAYLLGDLSEAESDRFEERYLEDESLFQEMQEIEDELIDDYASGVLTGADRTRFEKYFLRSSQRQEKVTFALAITEHAADWKKKTEATKAAGTQASPVVSDEKNRSLGKVLPFKRWLRPVPAWREWRAVAAAVLVAIGAGALWLRNRELRRELATANSTESRLRRQVGAESARGNQAETERDAARENANKFQTRVETLEEQVKTITTTTRTIEKGIVSAILGIEYFSRSSRGGGEPKAKTLNVPANARAVRLRVEFEETRFQTFDAMLQSTDGSWSWSAPGTLKGHKSGNKQTITLTIPGQKVHAGDYWLSVTAAGGEPIGSYYLKVVRR